MKSALDAGAAVGFFSQTLHECGLAVCGFDGRPENVEEARKRLPYIPFEVGDLQDPAILSLGKFDLVLCFGLLYHLESSLSAVRHLGKLTEKFLLLESMCIPENKASLLLRDEPRVEDQSLTDVAFYPSEQSIIKMLYRAGFAAVYRIAPLPDHDDFRETRDHHRRRTVLLASKSPIDVFGFRLCLEPREERDPWSKKAASPQFAKRLRRFLQQPAKQKYFSIANLVRRVIPTLPIPLRLPFGAWWLAENSELDHKLIESGFEKAELHVVETLLRPGMTVLDVGAHHGLYTLLCSKSVGSKGRVVAVEPSPRECRRLARHVRVNHCENVKIVACAASDHCGTTDLHVVDGAFDWGNSLRRPIVSESTYAVRVAERTIDDILFELGITNVDLIKLDVEGGELAALKGATRLLSGTSRPAILVEVQDIRTQPWGYAARVIVEFLSRLEYRWFGIATDSSLHPVSSELASYDANMVALPAERAREFRSLIDRKRMFFPLYHRKASQPKDRSIEILKSMVRVRHG